MGYDDAAVGGCWRFGTNNIAVRGVNQGTNPTNVYLGVIRPEAAAFATLRNGCVSGELMRAVTG